MTGPTTMTLNDLLAIIHGDGGQYMTKYGERKAINDAVEIVRGLQAREGYRTTGGQGSHWEECWRTHADCADQMIESLLVEVKGLKQALDLAHNETCEFGHTKHDDCHGGCGCMGQGTNKIERLEGEVARLRAQLDTK